MLSRRQIRYSNGPLFRFLRALYHLPERIALPAPKFIVRPLLFAFICLRGVAFFFRRVFIAEPLFKAYCTQYGKRFHTGIFVHWVQGKGQIIVGDDVSIDGKCSFKFAARYTDMPKLIIGNNSGISHNCSFTVGKEIVIGHHCRIASDVHFFDAPGHSTNPVTRMAGEPAPESEVLPIHIGDNVWIGRRCVVFPGVRIGDNSIVATGSFVMADVPANTVVGGNPARRMGVIALQQNA
jgi:acetyltransferase-like isoleucine patch superfamily enzyme